MKVGLIGHRGFLGEAFLNSISKDDDVVCFSKNDDLNVLQECSIIINANGNSSKFMAEKDPIADFNANATFTLELSIFAREIDSLLVHISSGEAITFSKLNHEKSNPLNLLTKLSNYGLSKAVGEILVKKYSSKSLIVRPGGLVGPGMKKGPIFDILENRPLWIHPKSSLNIMRTTTTAQIVLELAKDHLMHNLTQEEFNLTGVGTITLLEASMILNRELIFGENLPIYNSTIDMSSNPRPLLLPSSKNELIEFYLETTRK